MPRTFLLRALVITAVLALLITHSALAATKVYGGVAITVQNTQSIPTPPNFDLFLNISESQIANALGSTAAATLWANAQSRYFLNVLFMLPNNQPLYAWVMNFTSSWVAVWVKIPSGIPANSQFTILMLFTNTTEYPYTGVNPYIYGSQAYDNGPQVFAAYGYFYNQVPSGWKTGVYAGSFSPTATTSGLELINNAGSEGTYAYASIPDLGNYTVIVMWWYSGSADALLQELYGNPSTLYSAGNVGGTTTSGGQTPYAKAGIADQNEIYDTKAYIKDANGVASTGFLGKGTYYVVTYFAVQYHKSSGSANEWFGYVTVNSPFRLALPSSFTSFSLAFNVNSTNQPTVFIGAGTGGYAAYFYLDWVFVIPTPPNNVMPSIASVAPAYVYTFNFVGAVPSSSGISYQGVASNVTMTCLGQSFSYTNVVAINVTCPSTVSVTVTSIPKGWYGNIWLVPANTWVVGATQAVASNNTYYVVDSISNNTVLFFMLSSIYVSPPTSNPPIVKAVLYGLQTVSVFPYITVNGTVRYQFTSAGALYLYFFVNPGDTETIGITPNGLGVYFLSSNTTSYTIPSTPHQSTLYVPMTTGVFIAQSLGDWWNTTKPYYNLTLINGAGSTGSFTIKINGISNTASRFAWDASNPPNAIVYFIGTDGYTYAFNPAWAEGLGAKQVLVGNNIYFVPAVVGKTLTSANLAFISQGTWLNETTVSNSFMTYYPLPSFINFLTTPIYTYVNGTTSPRYLAATLAIINNNLQQYTVQYMNVTAWSNVGSLMGVAIIKTPFSFIGFVSNGSLAPIWVLLNSTVGVPPILFSYYPQIRYLLMPSTASTSYTLVQVYVNVPSQLFNQWSGNLVFGVSQAMSNGYYALVSGGFYAPPPTQFSLYVPTYLLNKLAQLFLASYPLSTTCTMLQVLSNPLETTICQGISQVVNINLGNTQVSKPAFGDVPGAFNIAPLTRNLTLEQIIAINAATAALVIIFVKKHQSLPAGLMLGGVIALAIGIFLWLSTEIGLGILLLVAGAALATMHRS